MAVELLRLTEVGLYCPPGDFHVDPWEPVERAVLTHAHSDHARPGSRHVLTARPGVPLLKDWLGECDLRGLEYGAPLDVGGVRLSLHPAGHILGSAQVRIEHRGQVAVVSGDYKVEPDATCTSFEPLRCDLFVTEATFALPIYRWRPQADVFAQINAWWRGNQQRGRVSIVYAYALGKAQRVLAGIDPAIGPVAAHRAVRRFLPAYGAAGVKLPDVLDLRPDNHAVLRRRGLVLAPPNAAGTDWARGLGPASTAFASGWVQVRGARRWYSVDRGFVLSDHADWPALLATVRATGARRVIATHGYADALARWLSEQGWETDVYRTPYAAGEERLAGSAPPVTPGPAAATDEPSK